MDMEPLKSPPCQKSYAKWIEQLAPNNKNLLIAVTNLQLHSDDAIVLRFESENWLCKKLKAKVNYLRIQFMICDDAHVNGSQ